MTQVSFVAAAAERLGGRVHHRFWLDDDVQRLTGQVQEYAWGSTVLIPELRGQTPTGRPQAELWLGAHPGAPSTLEDGRTLAELVESRPEVVGRESVRRFGPRLPYLLKLLAAAAPLSLQAHPTREQAEAGWAREEESGPDRGDPTRNYKDDWPKPEMIVALTDFEALCGFADPGTTARLWRSLGVPALEPLAELLAGASSDAVATVVRRLLSEDGWGAVCEDVVRAAGEVTRDGGAGEPLARLCRTALELAEHYPGDPGVLVALLMNRVSLRPGQALFLGAGNLHAYLSGLGVELMANSDNVLRGGLTPKHVDVEELTSVLDTRTGAPDLVRTVDEGEGRTRFDTPAPEFTLWRVDCSDTPTTVPATPTGRVVVVTSGRVLLRTGDTATTLHRGESAFLAAGEQVAANGAGVAWVAAPGVR
ncbi:mannose-6-phosphate isomerase, class I [Auraticoccus sp. F435]|uniref:mannose-6-phosphate isomerase n=1 Tax=Auraticoccus cholistanensis TaxID=2656650 RepID=A0A6A9V159_9ACTN|nr:mannose-6-phosphate isomerase, class I [Auraticoccus cholistanensis]MVA76520.1 mannose-6-phosphate isomerase, class I [Auraticoccus cholistanensis]